MRLYAAIQAIVLAAATALVALAPSASSAPAAPTATSTSTSSSSTCGAETEPVLQVASLSACIASCARHHTVQEYNRCVRTCRQIYG